MDVRAVYEFVAHRVGIFEYQGERVFEARFFVVTVDSKGKWDVEAYQDFSESSLPNLPTRILPQIIPAGIGVPIIATNKDLSNIWYGPKLDKYKPRRILGSGSMMDPGEAYAPYSTLMIDAPFKGILPIWYQQLGAGQNPNKFEAQGLGATALGVLFKIDPSFPNAAGFTPDGRYIIEISARGDVTAIPQYPGHGGVKTKRLLFNDWPTDSRFVWTNELYSVPWGAWKLNSTCTHAVTVLHGNPYCEEMLKTPGAIETRIGDPNEPNDLVRDAFQSAIFELNIDINETDSDYSISLSVSRKSDISFYETNGLGPAGIEINTEGTYYFAADYDENDDIVWARWYRKSFVTRRWTRAGGACSDRSPFCNAAVYEHTPPNTIVGTLAPGPDFCGADSGPLYNAPSVALFKATGAAQRWRYKEIRHSEIELQFNKRSDIKWAYYHEDIDYSFDFGYSGRHDISFSGSTTHNFSPIVKTSAGTLLGLHESLISQSWVDEFNVAHSGVVSSGLVCTASGEGITTGNIDSYTANVEDSRYDREFHDYYNGKLHSLHLPSGTVIYELEENTRGPESGEGHTHGFDGSSGFFKATNQQDTFSIVVDIHQFHKNTKTIFKRVKRDDPPILNNVFYKPDGPGIPEDGENFYEGPDTHPFLTRLWTNMVMNKPNPRNLDHAGTRIGFFTHWQEYYPRQQAITRNQVVWHPDGHYATRVAENGVTYDIVKFLGEKNLGMGAFETTHAKIIEKAYQNGKKIIKEYKETHPGTSTAEAVAATGALDKDSYERLQSGNYVTRGHWLPNGPKVT